MKLSLKSLPLKAPSLGSLSLQSLLESYSALSAREQRMLLLGVIAAAGIFVFGILVPLDRSVTHAQQRLAKKHADLAWMQSVAPEIAASAPPPAASGESLLVIVDRSARESGLASALAGSEPGGPGSLSVRLEKAPFDALIAWLARLSQQNGVAVDSATIEKAGAPGLVNAAIVLHSG
jgi:general secretion pathway protein M